MQRHDSQERMGAGSPPCGLASCTFDLESVGIYFVSYKTVSWFDKRVTVNIVVVYYESISQQDMGPL